MDDAVASCQVQPGRKHQRQRLTLPAGQPLAVQVGGTEQMPGAPTADGTVVGQGLGGVEDALQRMFGIRTYHRLHATMGSPPAWTRPARPW
jgi:hypothetical protein